MKEPTLMMLSVMGFLMQFQTLKLEMTSALEILNILMDFPQTTSISLKSANLVQKSHKYLKMTLLTF